MTLIQPLGLNDEQALLLNDIFLQRRVGQLKSLIAPIESRTIKWASDNLRGGDYYVNVRNFELPLRGKIFLFFREFYRDGFELGMSAFLNRREARFPANSVQVMADIAGVNFVMRIEVNLRDAWKRSGHLKKEVRTATREVFARVRS